MIYYLAMWNLEGMQLKKKKKNTKASLISKGRLQAGLFCLFVFLTICSLICSSVEVKDFC